MFKEESCGVYRVKADRVIVYCRPLNMCSDLYMHFHDSLGDSAQLFPTWCPTAATCTSPQERNKKARMKISYRVFMYSTAPVLACCIDISTYISRAYGRRGGASNYRT